MPKLWMALYFGKREVGRFGRGVPLDADDAEAQVGLLDHADVVAAVADRRRHVPRLRLLHHPHQLALLQRVLYRARRHYRVKLNLPKKVLRISCTKLSYLKEISTAYQQLPFFKRSAQLTHLTKVCC